MLHQIRKRKLEDLPIGNALLLVYDSDQLILPALKECIHLNE